MDELKMKTHLLVAGPLAAICIGCTVPGPQGPTPSNPGEITAGRTTKLEIHASLGEPPRVIWLRRAQREAWGYPYRDDWRRFVLWIEWSMDGTVYGVTHEIEPNLGAMLDGPDVLAIVRGCLARCKSASGAGAHLSM
jgi:hypothetical protein